MDNEQLITLVAAMTICFLAGIEKQLDGKSAVAGRIRKVEDALGSLAALNGSKLPEEMLVLGTNAYNHAIKYIASRIKGVKA